MPCDTVQKSTVTLELAGDHALIVKALESQGYSVTRIGETIRFTNQYGVDGQLTRGKLTVSVLKGDAFDVNAVKRAYSNEVVQQASRRYGWATTKTKENKYAVQRRK